MHDGEVDAGGWLRPWKHVVWGRQKSAQCLAAMTQMGGRKSLTYSLFGARRIRGLRSVQDSCPGHAVGEQIRLQSSGETWSSGMNRWSLDKFRHPRHEGSQRVELPRGEGVQGRR